MSRIKRIEELRILNDLSGGQLEWAKANYMNYSSFTDLLRGMAKVKKEGGGCHKAADVEKVLSKINILENQVQKMTDDVNWIVDKEVELLGVAISCSRVDDRNVEGVNCSCKDFLSGKLLSEYILAGELKEIKTFKVKNGKNAGSTMAKLTLDDGTCIMDNIAIFAESYEKFQSVLMERNVVELHGVRSKKDGSFIVNSLYQL